MYVLSFRAPPSFFCRFIAFLALVERCFVFLVYRFRATILFYAVISYPRDVVYILLAIGSIALQIFIRIKGGICLFSCCMRNIDVRFLNHIEFRLYDWIDR